MQLILGVDPGVNGGLVFMSVAGQIMSYNKMPKLASKEQDLGATLQLLKKARSDILMVVMEKVGSTFIGGKKQNFGFGRNVGQLEGLFTGMGLGFELVLPKTWQKVMHDGANKALTAKERSKLVAKRLWPSCDFLNDHDGVIDAALIAEYGRKTTAFRLQEASSDVPHV